MQATPITGGDLVATALCAVRRQEGTASALAEAELMICAAAAILAHELGVEHALDVLAKIAITIEH